MRHNKRAFYFVLLALLLTACGGATTGAPATSTPVLPVPTVATPPAATPTAPASAATPTAPASTATPTVPAQGNISAPEQVVQDFLGAAFAPNPTRPARDED